MNHIAGETARAAIIGYGMAGATIHSRLLKEAGWLVTVVLVNNEERRSQVRRDWPEAIIVSVVDELIAERDKYDAVVVASPTGLHFAHASSLLQANIPTIVDKPLGVSVRQCQSLVDLGKETQTPLTVFQNRRWDSEQLTLQKVLHEGLIGQVHTFERRWERWRPTPRTRWKEQDLEGGGLLLDLGAHLVDSAVQLFGPAIRVFAQTRAMSTPAVDDVFISLEHVGPGGHPIFSRLQAGSLVGAPGPRTRVLGNGGSYVVTTYESEASPFSLLDQKFDGQDEHQGWLSHGSEVTAVSPALGGHADFYRATQSWLAEAGPVPVDPQDCVHTARILDGARLSSTEHRVVELT